MAWNFLLKFWIVLDFLQEPLAWFSNFYLRVQSKNCGRNSCLIFLFRVFFGFWAKNFSDFWPKNLKKLSKLLSACPEEHFVAWNFLLKFWIVLDFLQEPLAWFSNFYLRVQSKNSGRNNFFILLFRFLSVFERKVFRTFGQNLQEVSKTTFYMSRGSVCGLNFISKVLNRFGFSAETFGMVLNLLSPCPE